ncbi:MAG TPA: tetratricopeptide repeat protein, partial [Armatimonadota bacterium]|nr:tetratricopeptide repeat protein [Armatimonadota bacterium]
RGLHYTGFFLHQIGRSQAAAAANAEALALFRTLDDPTGIADVLRNRGYANLPHPEHLGAARRDFEENLAIRRRIGDQPGVALALTAVGSVAQQEGDLPQAQAHYEEAVALFEKCGWSTSPHNGFVLLDLAELATEQGRAVEAWNYNHRALGILLQGRLFTEAAVCLEKMSSQALQAGDPVRAARLAGAADRLRPLGGSTGIAPESAVPQLTQRLMGILGMDGCERELAAGRGLSDAEVLAFAAGVPA